MRLPIEHCNSLGWKSLLRSSNPNIYPTLPSPPVNHIPKGLFVFLFLEFELTKRKKKWSV